MISFRPAFLLLVVLLGGYPATAQTRLDPAFAIAQAYTPAFVSQALQLADGSRVLVKTFGFERINRQSADNIPLCRFTPAGVIDGAFNTQMANLTARGFTAVRVVEYPGNKLLVALEKPFTVAGRTYNSLVRLNANGTVDASFSSTIPFYAYAFPANERVVGVQPDGKILLANMDALPAGTPRRPLVRLLADGSLDTAFLAQLGNTLAANSEVYDLQLQPDGKILVSGEFFINGSASLVRSDLFRLLPSGQLDAGFVLPAALAWGRARRISLQSDGKILYTRESTTGSGYMMVTRLLPNGSLDPTFTTSNTSYAGQVVAQPDGRILVATVGSSSVITVWQYPNQFLVRLLANGTPDPTFQVPEYGDYNAFVTSVQLLPNGQVLVASLPKIYTSATSVPTGLALLDATGAYVPAFAPLLQTAGIVNSVAVQPDGRLVIGGAFTEINGVAARNLARLNSNGSLDAAFTATCTGANEEVRQVAVQANGNIVLSGSFDKVNGQPCPTVARLLPTGQLDATFAPALQSSSLQNVAGVTHMAVQPDGKVLLSGYELLTTAGQSRIVLRLAATGAVDAGFTAPAVRIGAFQNTYNAPLLLLPNGNIVTGNLHYGNLATPSSYQAVVRLLPNGTPDPAFTQTTAGTIGPAPIASLQAYPDGRLLVSGDLDYGNNWGSSCVARLLPTGVLDRSFVSRIIGGIGFTTAIQPNSRILVCGQLILGAAGSAIQFEVSRLSPNGGLDASFGGPQVPGSGYETRALVIQPDGGILVAGRFLNPLTQEKAVLARLLDPNVLAVNAQQPTTRTAAYPVPAHGQLHLALDATARPQQVQLLDGRGRVVLTQATPQPELTLNTEALAPGLYLLRVQYAGQTATRRVVLE